MVILFDTKIYFCFGYWLTVITAERIPRFFTPKNSEIQKFRGVRLYNGEGVKLKVYKCGQGKGVDELVFWP